MRKSMVVYSSRSGDTKTVAEAIFDILPGKKEIYTVEEAPSAEGYDFIAMGFRMEKGRPEPWAAAYMKTLQMLERSMVGLFGTLGAEPDAEYARECIREAVELVSEERVAGTFLCKSRAAPVVINTTKKDLCDVPTSSAEKMAFVRASQIPADEAHLTDAQTFFREIVQRLESEERQWEKWRRERTEAWRSMEEKKSAAFRRVLM